MDGECAFKRVLTLDKESMKKEEGRVEIGDRRGVGDPA